MKETLKIIFFSCLLSVSYGASGASDNDQEAWGKLLEKQLNEADYTGMGPEIGSSEWLACRAQGGCQYP